jgi:hypothetical protein
MSFAKKIAKPESEEDATHERALVRKEERVDQRYVSKQPSLAGDYTAQRKYRDNVKRVTGPMINHPDYGEIFLLKPDEIPHSMLFLFDVNKFWFINMKENRRKKKVTIRPFIHKLRGYWFQV